jgi:hypothetical protein
MQRTGRYTGNNILDLSGNLDISHSQSLNLPAQMGKKDREHEVYEILEIDREIQSQNYVIHLKEGTENAKLFEV